MKPEPWTAEHFTQNNPEGPNQDDVPALLRRIAETVENYGQVEIQDLILHNSINEHGSWPSITVYFHHRASTET